MQNENNGNEDAGQIQVQLPPEVQRGVYANQAYITHTAEEFILDFILSTPPAGVVNARVVISPSHAKRLLTTLQDGIRKYESQFGTIGAIEQTIPEGTIRH